jgi:molybdopterin-guanine dinucleotide biosynthesis protein A
MNTHHSSDFPALEAIFDDPNYGGIGPAAGLLAAHAAHPASTLLVPGCDYPLLLPAALQQLILEYEPPLTCFMNAEGFTEPLIVVWSPEAFDALATEVRKERNGLNRIVSLLKGKEVRPLRDMGCNTREEWEEAWKVLQEIDQGREVVSRES